MKILLVRTIAIEEDLHQATYNNQGVGLATELTKLGNECGLVYFAKKGNAHKEIIESDGMKIKVYHIEGKNIVWNAVYNKNLYRICEKYDVIQTSECDQICSWEIYRRFPKKTVIYHGPYYSNFTWKYNLRSSVFDLIFSWRSGFKNAIVITKSLLAEEYLQKKGFINLITLGVGLNPYLLEQEMKNIPPMIERIIREKENNKYLLYIGAISKRKNLMFLLEVLNELVNHKKHKEYKMLIVGGKAYKEEKYYQKCFSYIKDKRLEDNVIHMGIVEQKYLKNLYENSDLYLLATQYDIFGMVYLEALYFGTPILTTMCGGSSLLIKEAETGYIRTLGDRQAWSDTAEHILENPIELKRIQNNGKELIRKQYVWSALAPKFLEVYHDVLSSK